MGKHKVFISYHHANDQYYKNALEKMNEEHEIFVNRSVSLGKVRISRSFLPKLTR